MPCHNSIQRHWQSVLASLITAIKQAQLGGARQANNRITRATADDQYLQLEQQMGEQQKHTEGQPCQVVPSQTICSALPKSAPEVEACAADLQDLYSSLMNSMNERKSGALSCTCLHRPRPWWLAAGSAAEARVLHLPCS